MSGTGVAGGNPPGKQDHFLWKLTQLTRIIFIFTIIFIFQTLLSFLPEGQGLQMRDLIKQNLDIEHIKQQAAHDALDFREKAQFIVTIMGRLCAPGTAAGLLFVPC